MSWFSANFALLPNVEARLLTKSRQINSVWFFFFLLLLLLFYFSITQIIIYMKRWFKWVLWIVQSEWLHVWSNDYVFCGWESELIDNTVGYVEIDGNMLTLQLLVANTLSWLAESLFWFVFYHTVTLTFSRRSNVPAVNR